MITEILNRCNESGIQLKCLEGNLRFYAPNGKENDPGIQEQLEQLRTQLINWVEEIPPIGKQFRMEGNPLVMTVYTG